MNVPHTPSPIQLPHATVAFGPRLGWTLCVLLLGNLVVQGWALLASGQLPPTAAAMAQNRSGEPAPVFPNNASIAQKAEVQLLEINAKLARIEATLSKPIAVRLVESIPLTVANLPAANKNEEPVPAGN